jgi:hypothetical protein
MTIATPNPKHLRGLVAALDEDLAAWDACVLQAGKATFHQCGGQALAPPAQSDGQTVDVSPAPVVPAEDRGHDSPFNGGDQRQPGIPRQKSPNGLGSVARTDP